MLGIGDYQPRISAAAIDGASLYSETLSSWLRRDCGLPALHRFQDLLCSDSARFLQNCSVVVSLFGPYAYLYAYWRHILGLDFRIIRHVHTGLWVGDLTQEWLCRPFDRFGDCVVFPSKYSESVHHAIFNYDVAATAALHPRFQGTAFPRFSPRKLGTKIRFALLGRLSQDKNIFDALESIVQVSRADGRQRAIEVNIAGGQNDLSWCEVASFWRQCGGVPEQLHYWGSRISGVKLLDFLRTSDPLIFFSTSNIESLGRVVLEARYTSTRYCVADWAAARELAAPEYIAPVEITGGRFRTDVGRPLGRISPTAGAAVIGKALSGPSYSEFPKESERYFYPRMLAWLRAGCPPSPPDRTLRPLCGNVTGIGSLDGTEAAELIGTIIPRLGEWERQDVGPHAAALIDQSPDPTRTAKFFRNVAVGRLNYADLGGYPFHIAAHLNFAPEIIIGAS